MNPMTWPREHQVALLLGIVLGIVLDFLSGTRTTAFILRRCKIGPLGAAFDGEPSAGWSALV
jgi:hypothetical protein